MINVSFKQKRKLLELYWELREAILKLSGISREDFEFGEQISKIETILNEIRAPTMMISNEELSKLQTALTRSKFWLNVVLDLKPFLED
jgi:hypothetical protein